MATAEWRPAKLDELGFVGRGKSRHRPRNATFLYGGPYPFFQTGDIKAANFYLTEYTQTYSDEGLAQSKLWKPGTLCITIAANIAESAILGIEGCFPDSVVGFIADPDKADVRFVKYYMEILKLQMQNLSRGTTQDNLSLDKLLTFDFLVPPLPVQRRIAGILSAYDDLIENSQRRIKILEAMARGLYREWFVHFRFPGHEEHPRVASAVGEIPAGWEVTDLAAVCAEGNGIQTGPFGSQLHQSDYSAEGVPVAMPKDLIGFRIQTDDITHVPEETADRLSRHRMQVGDIVYGRRGEIGRRAYVMPHQAGWLCGTGSMRLRPDPRAVNGWYLFNYLGQEQVVGLIAGRAQGVTMANLNMSIMSSVPVALPPRHIQEEFARLTFPMTEACEALIAQVETLRRTRDLLLPRLLAGQVELAEVA